MTVSAGCDVGSLTSKAVIMKDGRIIAANIIKSRANPAQSARDVFDLALKESGYCIEDIIYTVGTGYGREKMNFSNEALSEIKCHAKGARWLVPNAGTIVDIGGQDCKVIRIDSKGVVEKFVTNDKCASGTGRFLEVMAGILDVSLEELGQLSAKTKNPVTLSSTCTVWAQADIIKFINSGHSIEDIGGGINMAMAKRISILINNVGINSDICMTGGVAKNAGVVMSLEKLLGKKIKKARKADPQMAGAIGAALIASEKAGGR